MKIQTANIPTDEYGEISEATLLDAVPAKYLDHVTLRDLAFELEHTNGDVVEIKMVRGAVRVKGPNSTDYFYRGVRFEKREEGMTGYYGAWAVGKTWTDTFADCKKIIDARMK